MPECGKYHVWRLVLLAALVLGDLVTNNRTVSLQFSPCHHFDFRKGGTHM